MIIPRHWAEARLVHRDRADGRRRSITVRRFGWSDDSEAAAQAHAEARTREAMDRLIAGETLPRSERRVAYNGSDGVPIREEIVEHDGDTVLTRNGYGAICLNTPDVLFADIDFHDRPGRWLTFAAHVVTTLAAFNALRTVFGLGTGPALGIAVVIGLLFGYALGMLLARLWQTLRGGPEAMARRRVEAFLARRPDWRVHLYRTPAGLRLLATHRCFDPRSPEVQACFEALGVDTTYARMCRNQNCFRARVSPKPWRIGMPRIRPPHAAAWRPEFADLPERRAWIETYQTQAAGHAACRHLGVLGGGSPDPQADAVRALHDTLCQADSGKPIA